jgi:hypothetical protein
MKTNNLMVIAMVVLSTFASNAFAVLRPTHPGKPNPPDRIITIVSGEDLLLTPHRGSIPKTGLARISSDLETKKQK